VDDAFAKRLGLESGGLESQGMLTAALEDRSGEVLHPKTSSPTRSYWLRLIFKLAVSVLAVTAIVMTVDVSAALRRMSGQDPRLLVAAALVMIVQIGIGGLRWHVILRKLGAPAKVTESLRLFYIGVFFNTWLWGSGGDVLRVWLSYRSRVAASTAISSVILDRVAAVAGVALLVIVTAPVFAVRTGSNVAAIIPAGLAVAGIFGIAVAAHLHRLPIDWQSSRLLRGFQVLSSATKTIFMHPSAALPALGLAVLTQIFMAVPAYVVASSLGIGLTFLDCLVFMQPIALISAIPISIGGWGVRETAMIGLFSLIGIPASATLSMSVQLGLLSTVVALPGAVFWLLLKYRPADR